jgi:hypothetical protein
VFAQQDDTESFVDAVPLGGEQQPPTAGDAYSSSNLLFDPVSNRQLGRTHGWCTVTLPGENAVGLCFFSFLLENGTVSGQGPFPFNDNPVTLALTGGTGDYAGAHGTMTYTSGEGDNSSWTLTLLP